ncbi:response regulator transcription factor [Paenibacillus sp. MWE-103]|uniref:Response regulator transcription factor n=1 Tax=Paenibacillus artemisiicola TaxID=1172618 RepID=A0ABS3W465_9BACL|nr:response regulator transcription factor [Paenibacillus artemisiicola]MBO7743087.1 response regulator transcription factor [Paenibacillus artemisiicola]
MDARTILVVEDESILREIIKDYFQNEGYEVLEAADGEQALQRMGSGNADLIILDIMLPKLDGWSVCRRIRKSSDVPIIMLTARVDEDDTLLGFELGADDYVTKPYSPAVLLARAKRLLDSRSRRSNSSESGDTLTRHGIRIHFPSRTVENDGAAVSLTHTEFEILSCLMRNQGIVVTREQMINEIWGYEYAGDDRTINTHIRNLRIKLGDKAKLITTIVRTGYRFENHL